jgi:hypothetical protein
VTACLPPTAQHDALHLYNGVMPGFMLPLTVVTLTPVAVRAAAIAAFARAGASGNA